MIPIGYYPWGKSVCAHQGIDIFAPWTGHLFLLSVYGVVVYSGYNEMGGNTFGDLRSCRWKCAITMHICTQLMSILEVFVSTGEMIAEWAKQGMHRGNLLTCIIPLLLYFPYFWEDRFYTSRLEENACTWSPQEVHFE